MENTCDIQNAGYVASADDVCDGPHYEHAEEPEPMEGWEEGVEAVMENAWDEMQNVHDDTAQRVIGAAVVLVHEDGSLTISTGGVGQVSELKLGLAVSLGKARERLLSEAIVARKAESLAFLLDVALASRQR